MEASAALKLPHEPEVLLITSLEAHAPPENCELPLRLTMSVRSK